MIRSKSNTIIRTILSGVVVLLLLGYVVPAKGQEPAISTPNLDLVLVIDESGSMWEKNDIPSDLNQGWRIEMAKLFADLLSIDQSGASHRLSLIMFGTEADVVEHLTPIQEPDLRDAFKESIFDFHNTTHFNSRFFYTNIPAALDAAYNELATNGRQDAKKIVIFLTDGKCELERAVEMSQCNSRIREIVQDKYVGRFPIYTIAFSKAAYEADPESGIYENLWQEIADRTGGQYYKPDKAGRDLLDVYIKILRNLFNLSSENVPPPVDSPARQAFEISDHQMQLVFSVVKYDKDIQVSLVRPDGSSVLPTDPDIKYSTSGMMDSYSIMRPAPGTWYVDLKGDGQVSLIIIPFPQTSILVKRVMPGGLTHPAGKPLDLWVEISSNEPLTESLKGLTADVTLPDNSTETISFSTITDSNYQAGLKNTSQVGRYYFHFYSVQAEDPVVDDTQYIDVIKVPWVKIVAPKTSTPYSLKTPLPIQAQLMSGLDAISTLQTDEQLSITAILYDTNFLPIDTQQLKSVGSGVYSREMQVDLAGTYQLQVTMALVDETSKEQYQDMTSMTTLIVDIPVATAEAATPAATNSTPEPASTNEMVKIIIFVVLLLVVLGGGAWWFWQFNRPSLTGILTPEGSGLLSGVDLKGKKPVFMGSDPACLISVQGEGVLPRHITLRPIGDRKNPSVELRTDQSTQVKLNGIDTSFQILQDGDRISLGGQTFTYESPLGQVPFSTEDDLTVQSPDADGWKF